MCILTSGLVWVWCWVYQRDVEKVFIFVLNNISLRLPHREYESSLISCATVFYKLQTWLQKVIWDYQARSIVVYFLGSSYENVPFYVNSLTVTAMSVERFFLICRATSAKETWFFRHRKLLYLFLTLIVLLFPTAMVLLEALCYV